MDQLTDVDDLIPMPAQISSVPPGPASPGFSSANSPTEENLAHDHTALVEGWLHTMKSTTTRIRRRLRVTNPLFAADNRRGNSKPQPPQIPGYVWKI